jgi:predicted ATPase with chaperone activity
MLMLGSPGSGKALLARAMPGILPELSLEESLEVTRIYSVADALPPEMMIRTRPFRAPHHTISHAGLVGGGNWPHPGEISLAHRGVLFLDELPEFGTRVLEVMRQPIEDKVVTISCARFVDFSCELHACGGDESVSLRILRRSDQTMHLCAIHCDKMSKTNLRSIIGSY